MDQPTNDGVNTYFVSQAARQAGLTVVLSGLGGDEVFWGYKHYRWLIRFGTAVRCFSGLPAYLRNTILHTAAAYGRHLGRDRWARLSFLENRVSGESLYGALRGFFAPEQVSRLIGLGLPEVTAVAERYLTGSERAGSGRGIPVAGAADAHAFNYLELKRYLHDQLLRDTDVFSMAHSIEARVPYLDHLVVERAARVLAAMKLEQGTNKPLLVNAIGEPLVRDAAVARKRGFTFPFAQWMRETADQLEGIALHPAHWRRRESTSAGRISARGICTGRGPGRWRCWEPRDDDTNWRRAKDLRGIAVDELILAPGRTERNYWRDIWRFRELLYFLAQRDLLVRYKQTAIGVAWALIRPALTMAIFVAFRRMTKLPTSSVPDPLLVFAAVLPWQFFSTALTEASTSLINNTNLISKVYFPRLLIPASAVVTSLVDFAVTVGMLGVLMLGYRFAPGWQILTLPILVVLTFAVSVGSGLLLAALNVKYRDFRYIVPFIVQFGLFVSPIAIETSKVPERWRLLYSMNPMVGIIDGFRWAILDGRTPLDPAASALSLAMTSVFLVLGIWYFRRTERGFADII